MANIKNTLGFSLVELSVTIIIAGLALAAITNGAHLLQAAKLDKVIAEINGYVTATNNFKDKYKAWPGDMPNARNFWGTYNASTNTNGTVDGDGNGQIIGTTTEALTAWQQMALSGMIAGKYTGIDAGTPDFVPGTNVPASSLEGKHYYLYTISPAHFGTLGTILELTSTSGAAPWWSALSPSDAHIIDTKIDDGIASTGNLYAIRGDDYAGQNNCVDADYIAASANYILTDIVVSCRLFYWLNKQ